MKSEERREELALMLAPVGSGILVISTGGGEGDAARRAVYETDAVEDAARLWKRDLTSLGVGDTIVLNVPSDAGAGMKRGAAWGPYGIVNHLAGRSDHPLWKNGTFFAGDVRTIPMLLHDGMLSNAQIGRNREALYGNQRVLLPVSPLSIAERALDHLYALGAVRGETPRMIVLGGDHSVGWPAFASAFKACQADGKRLGCLHFDAHTDLMPHRHGIEFCFATWAYHANELLERDGRMAQVGIRTSGSDREHWESSLGVRQFWSGEGGECEQLGAEGVADAIIARFERLGVDCTYVATDIDGLSAEFAGATGTPEEDGLTPDFVCEVIRCVGERFPIVAGDLVEVAPPLCSRPEEPETTLESAAWILETLLTA